MEIVASGLILFDVGEFVDQISNRGLKRTGISLRECGDWSVREIYIATKGCASHSLKDKVLVSTIENFDRFILHQVAVNGKDEEILFR